MNIKKNKRLVLAVFLIGGLTLNGERLVNANPEPFTDISSAYAKQEIADLYNRGIVTGVGNGKFEPNKSISRAEFVTMLGRTLGIQPLPSEIPAFADVTKDAWEYGWVQTSTVLGIVNGTSPATFSPNVSITRQEAATLLVRALKITGSSSANASFADANKIEDWAKSYVNAANQAGIMQGFAGSFRPRDPITRQETAVVLHRILEDSRWAKPVSSSTAKPIHLGWQYWLSTDQYKQKVSQSETVNTLSPRWFFLEDSGTISDYTDRSLVDWAKQNNKQIWPLVGNHFDREQTHQMLSQPDLRSKAISQLSDMVKKYDLDGLNLDFENLDPADRDNFTAFVKELASALHANQAVLSVDVPMDLGSDWSDPYDYQALGNNADYIVIMGYDEHWNGSPQAGSVSSLPWLERGVDKITAKVPAEKVIVGLPFYTRDWYQSNGKTVSEELFLPQEDDLIRQFNASVTWDATTGQYVARYHKNGVSHTIWMEDSRSLTLKYRTMLQKGVAGVAYWYVGGETPDVWQSLKNATIYDNVNKQ